MKHLCFFILLSSSFFLSAQSITEQLGGTRVDLLITSDTITLTTKEQVLIQRAEAKSEHHINTTNNINYTNFNNATTTQTYAYGYGYQSLHLEFIAENHVQVKRKSAKKRTFYTFEFFDNNGELIIKKELSPSKVNMTANKGSKAWTYIYSIDLKDIPLVVLDKTHQINIIKHEHAWKYPIN